MSAIDYTALWLGLGAIVVSVVGGGFGMAWKLGSLERMVKDTQDDVHELKGQVRDLTGLERRRQRGGD